MHKTKIKCLPPYSIGTPFLKNFSVGYPLTEYSSASSASSVASTLANLMLDFWFSKLLAAFAYSGAKALQCPHQGASTIMQE